MCVHAKFRKQKPLARSSKLSRIQIQASIQSINIWEDVGNHTHTPTHFNVNLYLRARVSPESKQKIGRTGKRYSDYISVASFGYILLALSDSILFHAGSARLFALAPLCLHLHCESSILPSLSFSPSSYWMWYLISVASFFIFMHI